MLWGMNLSSGRDGQQKLCSSLVEKILKLYREGFPEDAIYQEYRMSQLVYSVGIKTAQPYEVISRGKRLGIVYDYVHGKTRLREKRYIELSGISLSEIERWTMPVAAARLVEWVPEEEKNQLVQCVRERLSDMIDT